MSTPYNPNAQVFEKQIVITNTNQAVGFTSGSIVNRGGLSTLDTYVSGHAVVNDVKITPNKSDIVFEMEETLSYTGDSWSDVPNFMFNSNITSSFKAVMHVTVQQAFSLYSLWEINGVYKSNTTTWQMTSSFSGDFTDVHFNIVSKTVNDVAYGQVQYKNLNPTATTKIRFRATTTAQPGTTPIGASVGVISNTTGPFNANAFIYASDPSTLASANITYAANAFTVGPASRILVQNGATFTNFSQGGSISAMGDSSIAKSLIVGEKIGIVNTAPQYQLDVTGDINFTGSLYQNGTVFTSGGGGSGVGGITGATTAGNAVESATNVTDLLFANTVRAFTMYMTVTVSATTNKYEYFTIEGLQNASGWNLYVSSIGDVSTVSFSITSQGQIQYTSGTNAGWTGTSLKWLYNKIDV